MKKNRENIFKGFHFFEMVVWARCWNLKTSFHFIIFSPKPYGRNLFRDKHGSLVPVKTLIWIWIYELQIWNWLRKRNYKLWVLNYASKKRNQFVLLSYRRGRERLLFVLIFQIGSCSHPFGKPIADKSICGNFTKRSWSFSKKSLFGEMMSRKYLMIQIL